MNNKIEHTIEEIRNINNGKEYQITLKIPTHIGWIENVKLIINIDNKQKHYPLTHKCNKDEYAIFTTNITLPTKAVYNYSFSYEVNNKTEYINNNIKQKLSVNYEVPEWAKGKIMYHIFVDRYKRGNITLLKPMKNRTIHNSWQEDIIIGANEQGIWNADFYGGDLEGIISSLDYIKSLGVSIIYLSPICWSQSNHRYDTSDYETIDPYIGINKDLANLCKKAHEKGIKIILDAVFNHTGNDSKYFNEYNNFNTLGAYQSKESKYYPFYKKITENNETKYSYWWGMKNLPVCDCHSKEWQEYITGKGGIIDKWFNLGIDGLRLDVADELTDDFIEKIRSAVHRNKKDGFILGEVWKNPMQMNREYIKSGKALDSVMNYMLIDALIRYFKHADTNQIEKVLNDINLEYPNDTIKTLMNFTSTHDISRAINIFASNDFDINGEWVWDIEKKDLNWYKNYKLTKEQYKQGRELYQAYIFTLTFLPGILSIFYGDEVGLEGMGNLANRRPYPWNHQDKKLLNYFKEIGKIRKNESFLENAELNILEINKKYLMFERKLNNEKALIAINRTNNQEEYKYPNDYNIPHKVYSLKKSKPGTLNPYGGIAIKNKTC